MMALKWGKFLSNDTKVGDKIPIEDKNLRFSVVCSQWKMTFELRVNPDKSLVAVMVSKVSVDDKPYESLFRRINFVEEEPTVTVYDQVLAIMRKDDRFAMAMAEMIGNEIIARHNTTGTTTQGSDFSMPDQGNVDLRNTLFGSVTRDKF